MQIFDLVNNLLLKNHEKARCGLAIQRYNVIPLLDRAHRVDSQLRAALAHP